MTTTNERTKPASVSKGSPLRVPRYESNRQYPSARTAGFNILSDERVLLVGVNEEQAKGLLTQQLPGAKLRYGAATAKDMAAVKGRWQAFTGRALKGSEVEKSLALGALIVKGPNAADLVRKATQIYAHLRTANMALVLIDWE
ncbi:hypothetical protein [Paraburkholderia nemoris]|uniref:hypothetical protein n=1 Tax=Paraburkholderia nemoris TaxID=2793076 RepID=UPI001B1876E7|nr:hypothetical protein [Paraburkholderia nemoris]CAE6804042.1 hypothetical protein LMG22931_05548 [Paraburkholderia nemoris]